MAQPQPLISVLIPVYNTEQYLKQCIDSVIHQTYGKLQIVVFNDGSTDSSTKICKQYAKLDKRIEYISSTHIGIGKARQRLIDAANGEYTIFVDSDDWIERESITLLTNYLSQKPVDIITYKRTDQKNTTEERLLNQSEAVKSYLSAGDICASLWTKMVKTNLYKNIDFDININYGEDVLTTWKLLNTAQTILRTNLHLYNYRNNQQSITNGDFGSSTYDVCLVWEKIVGETTHYWPQYLKYAYLQQTYSYIWLLYTALRSNITMDDKLKNIQYKLRTSLKLIPLLSISLKGKIFAYFSAYAYGLTRILSLPFKNRLLPLR